MTAELIRPDVGSLFDRFMSKVEFSGTGHWLWTAATDGHGYGQINVSGRPEKAHRVSWTLFVGPIPTKLTLDHLCRIKLCVKPVCLEPVTRAENTRRQQAAIVHHNTQKTECAKGHPYSEENTGYASRGYGRVCRICRAESNRQYRARKKARS